MSKSVSREIIAKIVTGVGVLFTSTIAVVIGLQIFTRTVFNKPFTWPEELSQILLIAITFLGTGMAEKHNAHIKVEFIFNIISKKASIIILSIGKLFTLFFISCMFVGEKSLLPRIMFLKTPAARIPYIWLHVLILFGFIVWAFYVIMSIKDLIQAFKD
jgi:TRAP-type C4-dicarboxylate transport system permease small subunit